MDLSAHRCLVDCDWLEAHLDEPSLVVIEATSLLPNYFDDSAADGIIKESGRPLWEEGHIPGSVFVGLLESLSDPQDGRFMYGMPSAAKFADVVGGLGIGDDSAVVIYDRAMNMWAARFWWMLRAFGFDNAVVLDGGFTQWLAAGKAVSTETTSRPRQMFTARPRPELIADRERVLSATSADNSCLINALASEEFVGEPPHRYARPGRIANSVSVPFAVTADIESQFYADDDTLRETYASVGAKPDQEVICYCGGGIAACSTALTLTRLGYDNVAVYDGSMTEWAADPSLPMETGPA